MEENVITQFPEDAFSEVRSWARKAAVSADADLSLSASKLLDRLRMTQNDIDRIQVANLRQAREEASGKSDQPAKTGASGSLSPDDLAKQAAHAKQAGGVPTTRI